MAKIFWIIIFLILISLFFIFPAFQNWILWINELINQLNTDFFPKQPVWFNFLIVSLILTLIVAIIKQFKK